MSSSSSRGPRRKFTDEFKAEAVAMVEVSGGEIARVARQLNIHDSSLGNWVRQAQEVTEGAPTAEERTEIRGPEAGARAGAPGARHPGKSGGLLLGKRPEERVMAIYSFIAEKQADPRSDWSISEMCRVLGVVVVASMECGIVR